MFGVKPAVRASSSTARRIVVHALHDEQRLERDLAQVDLHPPREPVHRRDERDQFLIPETAPLDRRVGVAVRAEEEVDLAGEHLVAQHVARTLVQPKVHAGRLPLEAREQIGDVHRPERRQEPDRDERVATRAHRAHLAFTVFELCERTFDAHQQRAAKPVEFETATDTIEEVTAVALLEPGDRAAEGRVRHPEVSRGPAQMLVPGDRADVLELSRVHAYAPPPGERFTAREKSPA